MPRPTYPNPSEREVFRTAVIPPQHTKGKRLDVTAQLLLTAVLLFTAVQLIW